MPSKVRVAIVGASGYTGEELVKLCLGHPHIELTKVTSRSWVGKKVSDCIHIPRGNDHLVFEDLKPEQLAGTADVFFLSLPHGVSHEFAVELLKQKKIVMDLSADFRLKDAAQYLEFYKHEHPAPELLAQSVYGSPELYRDALKKAQLIACPGCYPTSVLLALTPALRGGFVDPQKIVINSLSGISGAGKKAEVQNLFCECNESAKAYAIGRHRHLPEMEQELSKLAGVPSLKISFTPHVIPMSRGMLSTISAPCEKDDETSLRSAYEKFSRENFFVRFLTDGQLPEVRQALGTNNALISVCMDRRTNRWVFVSVIDNLLKGAAGQAIQCFNVRMGFDEREGLIG